MKTDDIVRKAKAMAEKQKFSANEDDNASDSDQ
jgi:hypothetical protein